ncbi:MFS transporter [Marinicauda salina]|uniref:MFS transporter n=1 Tax=Marinicauda salina TaxID=2135793 RepID=A0A2U2BVS7_9PROT|nr:efflux RND transporter permease subunit [Marinicauda salina]PWE18097.1 MFS transporter [Marinicauda salina]
MAGETDAPARSGLGVNAARISIEKPVVTWLIILFCVIGGLWGFNTVGRLEDPAFTIKEAVVFTTYPGASAEEVENEVTERLETAIQQMSQLEALESESAPGISEIHVEVRDEFDGAELPQVWDELRNRVADAAPRLPPGAGEPLVYDDFGDVYGILYAVTAPGYSDAEIRDFAEFLRRELLAVEGVAKVELAGVPEERVYIEIPQENLARLGLPVQGVLSAVSNENAVVDAGETPAGDRLLRIDMPQGAGGVAGLQSLLISPRDAGRTLRLSDIANVYRDERERADAYIYHDGAPAFTLGVSGLADVNIVDVGEAVEARLAALEADLPVGVELTPIYEQHVVVDEAIDGFLLNLALALAIVIGVLCVFMGWRAGLTVGAVLLLTVAGTVFFMSVFDLTMQRISLGALIIAMGMLVDNAIVVTESMQISVQTGERRQIAAEKAVASTQWPLLGATVIGIMAFSGIGLSPDSTGEFLFSLFAVIGISLMLSWALAITVAPMIAHYLFKSEKGMNPDPYGKGVYTWYRRVLVTALKRRWMTLAALIAITIASVWGFGYVKNAFFPNSNTPLFYVNISEPQGTDILATDETVRDIADFARAQPEAEAVSAFVGRGATRFMLTYVSEQPNPAYGQLVVRTARRDAIPALAERILGYVEDTHPDVEARAERIVFGPPSGAQLEARFSGPDADMLRRLGEEALARLRESGNVRDLRTDWRNREAVLSPQVQTERARSIGVTREDIGDALRFATEGVTVGVFREGDNLIPIVARAPTEERLEAESLSDRLIWSPAQNAYVPMNQVVEGFELVARDTLIQRRDRVRTLTVQANPPEGETAASAFERFSAIVEDIELPRGYALEWGGEHEAQAEAQSSLAAQLPLGFLVMLVISFLLFQTVRQPLIIWAIVPMSICGVTVGLLITDTAFSFTALLGFLSLSGMLIKNAIVLVDEVDQRVARGDEAFAAVRDGSVSRLRPVALAAGTTILGMSPLVFDAFFAGMAVTIIGGLAFATVLTLIAAPVLYAVFFRIERPAKG